MSILMIHEAFTRARADVEAASLRLATDRDRVDERVAGFLAAGWAGAAAESFAAAWDDWRSAACDVQQGLATTAELLAAVQHDLVDRDDAAGLDLHHTARRISGRLDR